MDGKQYMMLACPTLRREISSILAVTGQKFPVFFLPEELHLWPNKLREYLQGFISRLDGVDYLLLPMGRCGNGTIGLSSKSATLVLPKCEDCIDLLLSRESLAATERPKYSYFFTESWLDTQWAFTREYDLSVEKYGAERADMLMKAMYAHYKHFCYVDTGHGDFERAAEKVRPLAEAVGTSVDRLPAPGASLRKMLNLQLDSDFVLIPPGETVTFSSFER